MEDPQAIVRAAGQGNLAEVQRLVQQDRGLLDAVHNSWTPLTAASQAGRVEVIRYLLDEGAQVNLGNWYDPSAHESACRSGHLEAVSLLLARGADAAIEGWSPLARASANGHTDIVALLLAHGSGDIARSSFVTALQLACYRGAAGVVRALLGAGADPHVVGSGSRRPLQVAVIHGYQECAAVLKVRRC
jgi:ankyrin repeat protein